MYVLFPLVPIAAIVFKLPIIKKINKNMVIIVFPIQLTTVVPPTLNILAAFSKLVATSLNTSNF